MISVISYEDFLVHEITKSGQIVRLTDISKPVDEVIPVLDINEVLDDNTIQQIRELLSLDQKVVIGDTIEEALDVNTEEVILLEIESEFEKSQPNEDKNGSESDKSVKIPVNGLSKFERSRIHKAIRDNFEELETITVDEEDNKYIVVKRFDKNSVKRRPNLWPKEKGEYIHFILYKENKETQQAINELALKMHISSKTFDIAGTKDKRAVTTQMVSAWKVPPKKIWSAAQMCLNLEVGHFQFRKETLKLGDLKGNRFDIVLRDIKCEDRLNAEQSLESVKSLGFINYYGMQRFGHQSYKIGVLILRQKWEEVVESILSPKPKDMTFYNKPNVMSFNEGIDLWRKTRNATEVYKKFPYKWTPEGTLLKGLSRVDPNDFHGAICTGMVRNQRLLYLHCYQSYLWNKSASYRIRTYGLKVVAGDLLLLDNNDSQTEEMDPKTKDFNKNIVIADENNMKSASIYDIVIPIIGSDNLMPNNSVSDYIESLLAEEEITIDLYRNLPKQWCVFGTYRKLFVKPEDFEYQWVTYKDPNIPLIDSDLTLIKKNKNIDQKVSEKLEEEHKSEVESQEKLGLKLSMSLPSSTYATMLCRQITRTETTLLETKPWLMAKYNL